MKITIKFKLREATKMKKGMRIEPKMAQLIEELKTGKYVS